MLKSAIAFLWFAFQVWLLFQPQSALIQCPVHLGFAMALVILWHPVWAGHGKGTGKVQGHVWPGQESTDAKARDISGALGRRWALGVDAMLVGGIGMVLIYYLVSAERLASRMEGVNPVLGVDIVCGVFFVVAILECVRRVVGWSLLTVIGAFLVFGFAGRWISMSWMPEMFRFSGFTMAEAVENFTMTANGLLGVTTATSVMFVFYFVAFGAFYSAIGGGQLFTEIGLKLAGKQRGGSAKAAVVSSALMGTVSGSAVANVSAVGVFTIPLMTRTGYSATQAAAIEAISSTGGQLMPPVMGVAAFIMAELLQVPYAKIAMAGVIPAVAFYLALYLVIDLNARKTGVGRVAEVSGPGLGLPRDHALNSALLGPRLYLLLPPILLIVLLAMGNSASYAAACGAVACVPTGWMARTSRLTWRQWHDAMLAGARQAAEVAVPIAAIGLIIEVAVQSNLALKFAISLMELGSGNYFASLGLIVAGCIVMGMGLPTVAAYMIGAIFFVPVLMDLGFAALAAHFFVMFYCVLSMVTPPVALASFAAAGLAGADTMATSWKAFRLSLVAFFIPFVFIFEPALLAHGDARQLLAGLVALLGATALWTVAMEGYLRRSLGVGQRMAAGVGALGLFFAPLLAAQAHATYGVAESTGRVWAWLAAAIWAGAAALWCWYGGSGVMAGGPVAEAAGGSRRVDVN